MTDLSTTQANAETAQMEAAFRASIAKSIRVKNAMGPGANRDHVEALIDRALQWSNKGYSWNAMAQAEHVENTLFSMCLI
jgi:hypothetical protein